MAPGRAESDFGLHGWIDTLGLKEIFLIFSEKKKEFVRRAPVSCSSWSEAESQLVCYPNRKTMFKNESPLFKRTKSERPYEQLLHWRPLLPFLWDYEIFFKSSLFGSLLITLSPSHFYYDCHYHSVTATAMVMKHSIFWRFSHLCSPSQLFFFFIIFFFNFNYLLNTRKNTAPCVKKGKPSFINSTGDRATRLKWKAEGSRLNWKMEFTWFAKTVMSICQFTAIWRQRQEGTLC